MITSGSEPPPSADSLSIAWSDIVRFVRQLNHDLRNHLNAVELQAAYLGELATDPELKSEIKRLREMISQLGTMLQKLSADLAQVKPNFMPYRAADFVEDLRARVAKDFPQQGSAVNWQVQVGEANLHVDPQLLQQALLELFVNALRHEPTGDALSVTVGIKDDYFVFRLHEPKAGFDLSTENWGREPFRQIGQGHYGLGLNRVRVIVEVHGGEFRGGYDSKGSTLVTTVTLPVSEAGS
jgi:K+-sensing histidine kinase KdpD